MLNCFISSAMFEAQKTRIVTVLWLCIVARSRTTKVTNMGLMDSLHWHHWETFSPCSLVHLLSAVAWAASLLWYCYPSFFLIGLSTICNNHISSSSGKQILSNFFHGLLKFDTLLFVLTTALLWSTSRDQYWTVWCLICQPFWFSVKCFDSID